LQDSIITPPRLDWEPVYAAPSTVRKVDTVDMYEEWIAHPDYHAYVHAGDHWVYAKNAGWWMTTWRGSQKEVEALGFSVVPRVKATSSGPPAHVVGETSDAIVATSERPASE